MSFENVKGGADEGTPVARIAHFTTVPESLPQILKREITDLSERGVDVRLISGPIRDRTIPYTVEGIQHYYLPNFTRKIQPLKDIKGIRELWKLLGDIDIDILHTHTAKAGVYGRIVGRLRRIPVIVNTIHGLPVQEKPRDPSEIIYLVLEAIAGFFSDREFYLNPGDERVAGRLHRKKNVQLGGGVDLQRFVFDPKARATRREELGVRDDDVLIGGIGRRVANKGIREFIEVASRMKDSAQFIWIGAEDPEKDDALSTSELESEVRFIDYTSKIEEYLAAMDIFVLPSYREGLSLAAMEASSVGVPVVTTKIRGSAGLGAEGSEVIRTTPGDADELEQVLLTLVREPSLREELGRRGHERAMTHYDHSRVLETYIVTYLEIARKKHVNLNIPQRS